MKQEHEILLKVIEGYLKTYQGARFWQALVNLNIIQYDHTGKVEDSFYITDSKLIERVNFDNLS